MKYFQSKVSIFLERFFSHPHLLTYHVVISYSTWKWLNRAGKESHSLYFLLVSYHQVEAILNDCQADGPQCIVCVGLFQSLCTFLRHSVNPLLSKIFTDQTEVKKKKRIRVCKFFPSYVLWQEIEQTTLWAFFKPLATTCYMESTLLSYPREKNSYFLSVWKLSYITDDLTYLSI